MESEQRNAEPPPATRAAATRLLRGGLPSLQRSREAATPRDASPPEAEVREGLVNWFIGLRWIAVFASTAVVWFTLRGGDRVRPESAPYLWGGLVALALLNGLWSVLGARRLSSQRG